MKHDQITKYDPDESQWTNVLLGLNENSTRTSGVLHQLSFHLKTNRGLLDFNAIFLERLGSRIDLRG